MKPATAEELEARFISRIDKLESGCWAWTGSGTTGGYGRFWAGKRSYQAHRFAYELWVGAIPPGMTLDHLCHSSSDCPGGECRHRKCVNPDHLEPVTASENVRRKYGTGLCKAGHELTSDNCYFRKGGGRQCRTCAKDYRKRQSALRREKRIKC